MGIFTGTLGNDELKGTSGIDVMFGLSGDDVLSGLGGSDTIDGGSGNDVIYANSQANWADGDLDIIFGGDGDDKVYAGYGDTVTGGLGFDILNLDLSTSTSGVTVDFRPMTLLDLSGLVTIDLGGAQLSGFEAVGTIYGSAMNDRITVGNRDRFASEVHGADGNDSLRGGHGVDVLFGDAGDDKLSASNGKDVLDGGAGNDRLFGGRGADVLTGGAGADTFVFKAGDAATGRSSADLITDFSHAQGDKISLARIDAVAGGDTNDRFTFIGDTAFTGTAGELRTNVLHGQTLVMGDTNGDGHADFTIKLAGEVVMTAADFVL